jgi:hypothetical protein
MDDYFLKVQRIADEFRYIDEGERSIGMETASGRMIIFYKHGGKKIIFTHECNYQGKHYRADDIAFAEPTDKKYVELKQKYFSSTGEPFDDLVIFFRDELVKRLTSR